MIFEVSIVGGIVNCIVDFCSKLYDLNPDPSFSTDYYKINLIKSGLSSLPSNIISRIPGNIVERPVSVFCSWGLAILWKKVMDKFEN